MGISMNKSKITQRHTKIPTRLDDIDSPKILEEYNLVYTDFKEDLLATVPKTLPCSSIVLEKLIVLKIYSHLSKFICICHEKQLKQQYLNEMSKLFEYKGRALEGYFRYMNDYASLKLTHDIKADLIEEYFGSEQSTQKIISKYYKQTKGTYELQGCEELKLLMKYTEKDLAQEALLHQYEENLYKLKALYKSLIFGEIIDEEIYRCTVGIMHDKCIYSSN
ncbi:hypothetical protein SteCoe_22946 [Stentor coeruleus]|uniref:Uncharacterized protein n=1 Tax=Stentor coeruleus TaxID=5963 RepID=A0A1R2BKZ5_9CILI|nr:hypothetical protein SteCoe_22946 [Stentor coeruleus]